MRKVDPADRDKYHDFLKGKNTGIFRLAPDFDCIENNNVRVDGKCANFMPISSFYSFRHVGYVSPLFQDIGYRGNYIVTDGFFSQGILVSLGDVPIDKLELTDLGLQFLVNFKPEVEPVAANKVSAQLMSGIHADDHTYTRFVQATADTTFALRVIAYKTDSSRPRNSNSPGLDDLKFRALALDKRADVIAVFRIIKKDADGNLTIVWRRLSINDAPKMKLLNPTDSRK